MPLASRRQRRSSIDIWPGFVDALAQLLMVIIFILLVFTAGQFLLSDALSGRDKALKELQQQVSQLGDLLALERQTSAELRSTAASLSAQLKATLAERDQLKGQVAELGGKVKAEAARADQAQAALTAQQAATAAAQSHVDELSQSIAALRQQLAQVQAALDASEAKAKNQQTQIAELGRRLNLALATKVQELARYRSEFFGKLRAILGDRPDIRIVGDRFVFQSEVLFDQGSADLADPAKQQLDKVIAALKEIIPEIPTDLKWVLRVDGHTDRRPIKNDKFPSNWELSTERAISVVRYMMDQGIPPDRLAAAGFAEMQPLDTANTAAAYNRNRRIELRLTER